MSTRLKTFEDVWKVRVDATAKADKENCIEKHIENNNKSENACQQEDFKKDNKNNNLLNDRNRAYLEKLGDKYRALEVQNGVSDKDSLKPKEKEDKLIVSSKIKSQDQKVGQAEKTNYSNRTGRNDDEAKYFQKIKGTEENNEEKQIAQLQQKPQNLLIDPKADIFAKKLSLPNEYECTFSPISRVQEQSHYQLKDDTIQIQQREHQRKEREPEKMQQQNQHFEHENEDYPEDYEDSQQILIRNQYEEDSHQQNPLEKIKTQQEHDNPQFNIKNNYQSYQNPQQHYSQLLQSNQDEEEHLIIDTSKQNRLYEDAKVRKNKQQVIEKIVSEHRKQQTNTSKMTPTSQKIVLKKIEEFLGELVSKVSDETNKVSFEAVGEVLGHLGVLKHLKYLNGEAIINENELADLPVGIVNRMKEEMGLHETIWISLATAASSNIEGEIDLRELLSVPSTFLFNILLILLELKLTFQQANLLIVQILNTNSQNPSTSNSGLNLAAKLVTQFRKLFDDRTVLMETYAQNKKENTHENNNKSLNSQYQSNNNNSEMSFHPVINEKSRNIDNSILSNETLSGATRHELLFQQYKVRLEKQVQYNQEKKSNEVAGCTFKPSINPTKKKTNPQDEGYQSSDGKKSNKAEQKKHHERLYELASRKQEEIREIKEHIEFSKHEKEIQECTFKPKTSQSRYHPQHNLESEGRLQQQVKGTETQLMRMEKARRDKQDKEQFFIKQQEALRDKNQKIQHKIMPFSFDTQDNNDKMNLKGIERNGSTNGYDQINNRNHNTAGDEIQTKQQSKPYKNPLNSQNSHNLHTPQALKSNGRQIEKDTVKQRGYSSLGFQRENKQNSNAQNSFKSKKVTEDDDSHKANIHNNIPIQRPQKSQNIQPKLNKNINSFNTNFEQGEMDKQNLHEQIENRTNSASLAIQKDGCKKQKKTPTKVLPFENRKNSTTEGTNNGQNLKDKQEQVDHSTKQSNRNTQQQTELQTQDISRRLLGHIDVNITKNKKAKVILHEGDNAEELAQNFAKVYGIAPDVTETLSELLKTYILQFSKKPK